MTIPKRIFQTSLASPAPYVVALIKEKCPNWEYLHFTDDDIFRFFETNPLKEFPKIRDKFLSFSNGAHRADLFRYYYLYLKGGVFLDSDAALEKPIENIIGNNHFVSIKSYHLDKNLLFNGFLVATPKHPILHQALQHLYNVSDKDLQKDYFLVCKQLHTIVQKMDQSGITLHQERKDKNFRLGARSYNSNNDLILTHYCQFKVIPDFSKPSEKLGFKVKNNALVYKFQKKINKLKKRRAKNS